MKIALIGYGKMGALIDAVASAQGHDIIAKIDPKSKTPHISAKAINDADVCIDFSRPAAVLSNVKACAALKKNMVIGTTGWEADLPLIKEIVNDSGIGCIHSANFSIGVNLFMNIVAHAAELLNLFDEYDVAGFECHHRQKVDAPSGTAKALIQILRSKMPQKKTCDFSSIRCGSDPGTHTILFDSPADTITLTHQARNRQGFAMGAVAAAEWIVNKHGLFTIQDFLNG